MLSKARYKLDDILAKYLTYENKLLVHDRHNAKVEERDHLSLCCVVQMLYPEWGWEGKFTLHCSLQTYDI